MLGITRMTQNASNVQEEHGAQLKQAHVQTVKMADCLFQDQQKKMLALVSAYTIECCV